MINKIIHFSIKNKALIWLMTIGLIIGGLYSMTKVPLDAMPDITNNQVLVITTAPNLGTEDIEKFVTYQVELAVANLPDVTEIRSVSRFGLSVVTIVFKESAGTYLPRQLVSEALSEVKEKIPKGFGEPFMAPISTGLGEIYQYTLDVDSAHEGIYSDMELRTMQDWIVKRQMAMLPGVVEVNSFGGHAKQYEVAINPEKLKSMGVSMSEVYDALQKNNQNTGGAYIEKNHQANFIRGEGLMRSIKDVENTLVKNIDGNAIFIRDIAEVKFGSFVRFGSFVKNGKGEAVGGIIMMLKGENSNDVISAVKERVEQIQKSLPEGVMIKPFLDRSKLIKSTTSTVAENLALGALIVIFILVIFLGNIRGGLIVASTIPLALLFAFIMMHIFGVWANLMSLGALDFGILIDGAVIIVESMMFYLHKKGIIGTKLSSKERDDIAYKSASKMMNAAFFGQLIILIVFIPVLTLEGVEGKMFIPMAMTFGFAVLGVMLLSLTYIPMVSATFLKAPKTDKKSFGDKIIIKIENLYSPIIDFALRKSKLILIVSVIFLIAGGFLFTRMGAVFIPKLDEGDFAFQTFFKPGTSLSEVTEKTNDIHKLIMDNFPDEIESIQGRIGVADLPMDPMPLDIADNFVIVKPMENWTKAKSKEELINKISEKISIFTGINYEFTQPIEMRFNELLTGVREDIAIKLYGDNLDILAEKAQEISSLVSGIQGVSGVKAEATKGLPQITIKYDRNMLARYGLNINELNTIVQTAFSGGVAGKIYEGERMFDLVVRLDKQHRSSIDDIRNLYVNLPNGNQIPLQEVANIDYQPGPMQIGRDNTNRRTYVGINVKDRDIKSLVGEIKQKLDANLELPTGYYIRYGGAFENLERASKKLTIVVPLALVLIFMLVFFAIKSFKQTMMIYIAIPFAAVGGVFSLYLRDMPFSISAGVGFIVLFGVAVLNGLVLISGFNELKEEGKLTINDIVKKGSIRRIRPILLTASTDILGFIPMAVSNSAGAEVQRPLATVVIGGMLTATFLTLIVLPILYKIIENKKYMTVKLNNKVVAFLFLGLFLGFSVNTKAQTTYNLQQIIDTALVKYPSIKSANLKIDKQKALKATAWDFGTTTVYTGKEETNSNADGIHNKIGIQQDGIDIFGMYSRGKMTKIQTQQAIQQKELTEAMLIKNIKASWYKAARYKQNLELFIHLDSLYTNFVKASELRNKTGESSNIEHLTAISKYTELKINKQRAENDYYTAILELNKYINSKQEFDIDISDLESNIYIINNDSIDNSPILSYYATEVDVAKAQWKAQKTNIMPKLNLEYKLQSVDGVNGFNAWQVGVSMPLVFFAQNGQNKAAKIDYQIATNNYDLNKMNIDIKYKQLINRYQSLQKNIAYYNDVANPLADEQIKASNIAYKLGSIDYMQYIQSMESAIEIKKAYLEQQQEYLSLSAELEYINGKQ